MRAFFRLERVGHRMVNQSVMVSTQVPLAHVRSEAPGKVGCRLIQALKQQRIAPGQGIRAKRPIRSFQQCTVLKSGGTPFTARASSGKNAARTFS